MITSKFHSAFLIAQTVASVRGERGLALKDVLQLVDVTPQWGTLLLFRLKRAGIVTHKKGKGGGYFIADRRITALDVHNAVNDRSKRIDCVLTSEIEETLSRIVVYSPFTSSDLPF
jgi:DNA-binding IscR family transcriptional regulator